MWYYNSCKRADKPLRLRIRDIAESRVRYGFWRIYKEEGLNLRGKRPRLSRAASHRYERPSFSNLYMIAGAWS